MQDSPVKLDLRELTQAHVDEALPHMGACSYAAPCIIGTLMKPEVRERLDNKDEKLIGLSGYAMDINPMIAELDMQGVVEFPDAVQVELAAELQGAFDNNGIQGFRAVIDKVNKALGLSLEVPKP